MKLGIYISNGVEFANPIFLNQLEEAWHDEPFSASLEAAHAAPCRVEESEDARRRSDPEGLAQVELRPGRPVEITLPLIEPAAA